MPEKIHLTIQANFLQLSLLGNAKFLLPSTSDGWAVGPMQGKLDSLLVDQDTLRIRVLGGGVTILQGWVQPTAGATSLSFRIDDVDPKPGGFQVRVETGKGATNVVLLDQQPKVFSVPV